MVLAKIKFGETLRRVSLDDASLTYNGLRQLLNALNNQTLPTDFHIKYLDDENDHITISNDLELKEAFTFARNLEQPILRLVITKPPPPPSSSSSKTNQFSPSQLFEIVEAALAAPEVQNTWRTIRDDFSTCVEQVISEGRNATQAIEMHPQFTRVQSLLTERLPQAIRNDLGTTIPQLVRDIQNIFQATIQAPQSSSAPVVPSSPPPTKTEEPAEPPVRHHAICDSCEQPIVGIRYKCSSCPDYDLCEACEAKPGVHDASHQFLKLRKQLAWCFERTPLLPPSNPLARASRCPYFRPHQQYQHQHQKPHCGGPRGFGHFHRLSSRFISDVTIEDGTVLQPGETFTKVWRVRNDGNYAWPEGTALVHVDGPLLSEEGRVDVPTTPPGEEVEIAVKMVAPPEPGTYVSNWRLAGPRGFAFGHRMWVEINVQAATEPESSDEEFEILEYENEGTQVSEQPTEQQESPEQQLTIEDENPEESERLIVVDEQPAMPEQPNEETPALIPAPGQEQEGLTPLDHLEQMGFTDRALNAKLLSNNRGNILATVHQLLNL